MSKVFRINTSNIEGVGSNENNSGRILAKGEVGFYDNNFGKLELVLGDGAKTHLKNKILGKGVFYGGNADSGDGYGFDTIKLIPDATLHFDNANYNNHQYLVIDPTYPNHIHIRAGGTQDASTAELFLGGENTNVKVSDDDDSVTIKTLDVRGETPAGREWVFDNTGKLTLPGGVTVDTAGALTNGDFNITLTEPMTETTQVFKFTSEPGVGALGFPDGTFQTTAANLNNLEIDESTILTSPDDTIVIQPSYRPTVTRLAGAGSGSSGFLIDITEDDDITAVTVQWECNTGTEETPVWSPVSAVGGDPGVTYLITVGSFEFVEGTSYTFRQISSEAKPWTFRPIGTLVTPAGIILSSDYQAGNPNYRDFSIEMLEPGDAFEHRWIFRNDATLSIPGDIEFSGGTRQSVAYTRSVTTTAINAGTVNTLGLEGADTIVINADGGYTGNDTQNLQYIGRNVEGMRTVLINNSTLCTVNFDLVNGTVTVNPTTVVEVVFAGGELVTISERSMV